MSGIVFKKRKRWWTRVSPRAALTVLRLVQTVIRSADQVDEATRTTLDRQVQAQYLTTVRAEERIVSERAERLRREAAAEQQLRTVDQLAAQPRYH